MQTQSPTNQIYFFNGLNGLVSRFLLTNTAVSLPTPNFLLRNPLFDLNFQNLT
jgi:hypothetical protein